MIFKTSSSEKFYVALLKIFQNSNEDTCTGVTWPVIREHRQKTFVMLSGFWLVNGVGGLSKSIKKVKFVTKSSSK